MLLIKLPLQRLKRLLHSAVAWQPLARPGVVTACEMASMMRPPCRKTLAPFDLPLDGRGAKVNRETKDTVVNVMEIRPLRMH